MWTNFFAAGGWGMFPTSFFGFLLIAAGVLYGLRPEPKAARLVLLLGLVTLASGFLGTFVGICNTLHYLRGVAKPEQLEIAALGCEESLHVVVLSLILAILGGLVSIAGALRSPRRAALAAPVS
jgi:uncharacterized membrane protein